MIMKRKQKINIKCKNIQAIKLQRYFLSEIRLSLVCVYRLHKINEKTTSHTLKAWHIAEMMLDLDLISEKNKKILDEIIKKSISIEVATHCNKYYRKYM